MDYHTRSEIAHYKQYCSFNTFQIILLMIIHIYNLFYMYACMYMSFVPEINLFVFIFVDCSILKSLVFILLWV